MESIKTVVCNKLPELDKKCDKYLLYNKDDEYLLRFKQHHDKLYNWEEEDSHKKIIQLYAQAVLDLTFFEETKLTTEEFRSSNSKEILNSIIDSLTGIEDLCREYTDDPVSLLGEEIVQCLLWRKGALLYMYCATVEDKKNLQQDLNFFLKCLQDGIVYLEKMISVKKPLRVPRSLVTCNDEDTYFLLSEGIYSDTILLGLMYAGEMCYWFCKHYDSNCTNIERTDMLNLGKKFLLRYIKAGEGPLKGKGWNTKKAKELLALVKIQLNNQGQSQ